MSLLGSHCQRGPMQIKNMRLWTLWMKNEKSSQASNQLGTPVGAKSFLRGAQIFWTMSNSFKLYPKHFSRGLSLPTPPLVTRLSLHLISEYQIYAGKGSHWRAAINSSQLSNDQWPQAVRKTRSVAIYIIMKSNDWFRKRSLNRWEGERISLLPKQVGISKRQLSSSKTQLDYCVWLKILTFIPSIKIGRSEWLPFSRCLSTHFLTWNHHVTFHHVYHWHLFKTVFNFIPYHHETYLFNDNFATGVSLITALWSCHDELI